ncbi:MAG: CoA-binding protein [Bacteroidetes bacterium]|nr:CoA-binding protein [Bacteroidota bacterium]HET6245159.1 CoA-binding protein [Bacteroidia bacterium]
MKRTVILGASSNPGRYAHIATLKLHKYGHPVFPVGIKDGIIKGIPILTGMPAIANVDTITLYIGSHNQPFWYEYIFSLNPKRIIFNPGTENDWLYKQAEAKGIEALEACTLIMLSVGNY